MEQERTPIEVGGKNAARSALGVHSNGFHLGTECLSPL